MINFFKNISKSLETIQQKFHKEFLVHEEESVSNHNEEMINSYGDTKWKIVDLVNEKYGTFFDLYNWLHYIEDDELAYFLNEMGSNVLHNSQFKAPSKFHLWMGEKGFIVGIEQKGKGFNAQYISEKNLKENEGSGFSFLKKCNGEVFFDDPTNAKVVYFEHLM
jgi:hypothetical protein